MITITTTADAAATTTEPVIVPGFEQPPWARTAFRRSPDGGVCAEWLPVRHHAGFTDRAHGGILATLLDSAMVHALAAHGALGVTGDLRVRYHRPVPLGIPVTVEAVVTGESGPAYRVSAAISSPDTVLVSAQATFVRGDFSPDFPLPSPLKSPRHA